MRPDAPRVTSPPASERDPGSSLHPVAAGIAPPVNVPVRAIVGNWGITPSRVVRLGGNRNVHWIVDSPEGQFILRRYRHDRGPAAVAYEFAVIANLASEGWPVAEPVGSVSVWKGQTFALFPRLRGRRPRAQELAAGAGRRGALLGRLHRDLGVLALGQRAGWCRLDEFIRTAAEPLIRNAEARLRDRPQLRDVFVRHTISTHRTLTAFADDLPCSVIHGDFAPWNLLWRDGRLTGLIDFDDVRLDLRAADVAIARRRDREGVVEGYRGCAQLTDEEHFLLAPLWRAYTLRFAADLLRAPSMTSQVDEALQWCARQLAETVPSQMPRVSRGGIRTRRNGRILQELTCQAAVLPTKQTSCGQAGTRTEPRTRRCWSRSAIPRSRTCSGTTVSSGLPPRS
jgi:Ser/Thr protein kinase RdoA (MazF antagonist)